jgi:hypothetical protein
LRGRKAGRFFDSRTGFSGGTGGGESYWGFKTSSLTEAQRHGEQTEKLTTPSNQLKTYKLKT